MIFNAIQTLGIIVAAIYLFKIDHPGAGGFLLFVALLSLTFVVKTDDSEK